MPSCLSPRGVRSRQQDAEVGDVRVRGPHLLAAHQPPAVAVGDGLRLQARQVAPRARLAEPLAPDLLAGQERREVAALLLLGPVGEDRRAGHPQADHADVLGRLGAAELLEQDRLVASAAPRARRRPSARSARRTRRRRARRDHPLRNAIRSSPAGSSNPGVAPAVREVRGEPVADLGCGMRPRRVSRGSPCRGRSHRRDAARIWVSPTSNGVRTGAARS